MALRYPDPTALLADVGAREMSSRTNRIVFLTCAALFAVAFAAVGGPAESLVAIESGPTPILSDLQELTDEIGGRPTGSPALDRAVQWGLEKFKAAGLENVHAENYLAAGIWLPGVESGQVTAPLSVEPKADQLRVAAMPFSISTSAAGLDAAVVDVGHGDAAAFAAAGSTIRGRWVLVESDPLASIEDLDQEYSMTPPLFAAANAAGAAGILWMSTRPGRLLYRHNVSLNGSLSALPGAVIERDGALRLARLLRSGQTVRVRLNLQSSYVQNARARNVVAELGGRDKAAGVIILGAHLDSWDLGRGALDDGCNIALTIDVARSLMQLATQGRRPRRTVRFVMYTGEEDGFWGAMADVREHRAELDRVKAMIELDMGSGRITGFSLGGRQDLLAAVDHALAPAAALGPFTHTSDAFVGSDNYDYLIEGVPTLESNQDEAPYLPQYHAESDTLDKVDAKLLKANAAIVATLVWGLADTLADPAPRQSRAEVEALLSTTGLDDAMRTFGLWEGFATGARGRAPNNN
jgi:Iap family predicted aminopeptidase